ncbi:MAG: ExeM/NucH family extracellular endonuclease [Thermoanaerobaculia bacterium]
MSDFRRASLISVAKRSSHPARSARLLLAGVLLLGGAIESVHGQTLVINEIDYDQASTDTAEFVEIKNTMSSSINLSMFSLEFVNGNGTTVYDTINLPNVDLAAGDYFVVCANAATVANCDLDDSPDTNFIQNGAPDAVALLQGIVIIDTVSYEGDTGVPYTEGSGSGLADSFSASALGISRFPDGTDTNQNNVDFSQRCITPGEANATADTACSAPATPPVVINEIMQNPSAVSDSNGEWFEIFNPNSAAVDIDGWTIEDNGTNIHVIDNGGPLLIPAAGFVVLGIDADSVTNGGVTVDYEYSNFFLSNGDDEVVLLDKSLNEIDRVEWDGGPSFPDPTGASMSLEDPALDNNTGANWCEASTPFGDGDSGTPGAENTCGTGGPPFGVCGDEATFIHEAQGSGPVSPIVGATGVVLEGVVVGDFQATNQLGGFFLQEEDTDHDADPTTSEGIFVFDNGFGADVDEGDVVRVQGDVNEFFGLTELNNVSKLTVCSGNPPATAALVTLPVASLDDWETAEGMLVTISQTLYASGNFDQGRFGEVELSVGGPLDTPTNVVAPGAPALALQDLNNRMRIELDDGSVAQNPLPLPPYIGAGNTLRTGDTIPGLTAALSFAFGTYELHPVDPVTFTRVNVRTGPPIVGGVVTVAAFNVLNYFTTLDDSGPICGPLGDQGCRGADNTFEFDRQRAKLVAAISNLDADVVGLIELENHLFDDPIADLVDGLNDAVGAGTYAYVPTGAIGSDAIRVGLIYQPAAVSLASPYTVLDSSVDPMFNDDKNRPVLAQSFQVGSSGLVFTVAVNHLKSKGSPCDDVGDTDAGDGQGNCNGVRTDAAAALVSWLAMDPTGSSSNDFLILGDLNAYAQEDPVTTIEVAGYNDLIEAFLGTGFAAGAYSFNFIGESGYLDHALSSPSMTANVTGVGFWHINADEPRALDYNDFNQPALFSPDEFRSSDHDPVVVGLFGDGDDDGVLDPVDVCPGTVIPESVPTKSLGTNRWALVDDDGIFDTKPPNGNGPGDSFTIGDTGGCSCEQIIEALGLGKGHEKHGCSVGAMRNWVDLVNPQDRCDGVGEEGLFSPFGRCRKKRSD